MGLWHLNTVAPCLEYIDQGSCVPPPGPALWGPLGLTYNGELITCPKHYRQSTNSVANFFYEPGNDRIIAHIVLNTTYWPGWDVQRYEFNAEDGAWCNREEALARQAWIGIWGAAYTQKATMGSFNKIYACRNNETKIREVSWEYAEPATNGWWVDPYTWNPKSIYGYAVVNRIDNLLAAAANWTLDCWRNIGATPDMPAWMPDPAVSEPNMKVLGHLKAAAVGDGFVDGERRPGAEVDRPPTRRPDPLDVLEGRIRDEIRGCLRRPGRGMDRKYADKSEYRADHDHPLKFPHLFPPKSVPEYSIH